MPTMSRAIRHLLAAAALVPVVVRAEEVLMSAPVFAAQSTHRIASVDPAKRTLSLEQLEGLPFPIVTSEGTTLVLVGGTDGGPPLAAIPIEITALEPGRKLTATFKPAAARRLVVDSTVFLVRPFAGTVDLQNPAALEPASTAALRSLPDVVENPSAAAPAAAGKAVIDARTAARRVQSLNNVKQIMLAMHNFHDAYGFFPPAAVVGPDGRPWHSWRVFLLPFLEELQLYQAYDFTKPWDAPENLAVAKKRLTVFIDPQSTDDGDTVVSYGLLVGKDTIFQPDVATMPSATAQPLAFDGLRRAQRISQITDGTSKTICVASFERDRDTPWTKPDDIIVDDGFSGIGKPGGIAAPYPGDAGDVRLAIVGFCDGSVRTLPSTLPADLLRSLLTRNGGEVIDYDALGDSAGPPPGPRILRIVRDGNAAPRLEMQ